MKRIETRSLNLTTSSGRTIQGFIPYNSPSEPLPFIETIARGAFTKTLRESKNIRALYAHEDNSILASTRNGSLKFEDREDGLHFEFELPNTRLGDDVQELVRTGLVDGCSFGMIVTKDEWSPRRDRRTIKELRLFEVSLCPQNAAYQGSSCVCRSLSEALKGAEMNEENKAEVEAEIAKLQEMLNGGKETTNEDEQHSEEDKPQDAENIREQQVEPEEPKAEPEPESQPEEPKQEPSGEGSEPQSEPDTPAEEPKEEDNHSDERLEALLARLDAVESLLKESEATL